MELLRKICFWRRANNRPSGQADADGQMQEERVCRLNQIETQIKMVLAEIEEMKKFYIADRTYVRHMFREMREGMQLTRDVLPFLQAQIDELAEEMEDVMDTELPTIREEDAEWNEQESQHKDLIEGLNDVSSDRRLRKEGLRSVVIEVQGDPRVPDIFKITSTQEFFK
jgi:hypothetical protein